VFEYISSLHFNDDVDPTKPVPTYRDIAAHFERTALEVMRGFMPEYYIREPADYWPVKTFAVGAMLAGEMRKQHPNNVSASYFCRASLRAVQFETPTFFVTRELTAAALRTELPADLVLNQVRWPISAMLFMLPRGSVRHETEGDCPFVLVSNCPEILKFDDSRTIRLGKPRIVVATVMPNSSPVQLYHAHIDPDKTVVQTFEALHKPFYLGKHSIIGLDTEDSVTLDSARFAIRLAHFGLTLVLLLGTRPELIEYGKLIKTVKPKHPDGPSAWYGPNFVGRTYTAQRRYDSEAIGRTTRPHWVRGHLKHQAYGLKNTLRRLVWIEPYRTGGSANGEHLQK
jgi:hypothetical protein